jgi:hypothetical protein
MRHHLNSMVNDQAIDMVIPHNKMAVARITWEDREDGMAYMVTYQGCLAGLHGRRFRHVESAEHAILAEYLESTK